MFALSLYAEGCFLGFFFFPPLRKKKIEAKFYIASPNTNGLSTLLGDLSQGTSPRACTKRRRLACTQTPEQVAPPAPHLQEPSEPPQSRDGEQIKIEGVNWGATSLTQKQYREELKVSNQEHPQKSFSKHVR